VWATAGVLHVLGDAAQPGLLASEEEVASLEERIPPLGDRLAEVAREIDATAESIRDARGRIVPLEEANADARQRLAVLEARLEDLSTRHGRLSVERETLDTEVTEIERELELIAERRGKLQVEFTRAETRHAELEQTFDQQQSETEGARRQREETSTAGASRRGRHELLDQRLDSHRSAARRIEGEIAEIDSRVEGWKEEDESLTARREEIGRAMEKAEAELQKCLEERAASQDALLAAQQELDGKRTTLQAIETRLGGLREDRDAVRAEMGDFKVERATHTQDAEHLQQEHRKEFDEPLPTEPGQPPANLAEIEVDFERCEGLLERLGPVNLLAAEEHAEHEERHEFLTSQRTDVADSVDKLRATIRELDRESRERFLATFREVN
jgi:chromosome segregation protein